MPRQKEGKGMKRKKNYYVQYQKKQRTNTLEPGTQGFLITCNSDERRCIREAYNILNEFAGQTASPDKDKQKKEDEDDEEEGSVEEELREELESLRSEKSEGRSFQQVYTGIQSCLFISSKLDPCPILLRILEDIQTRGQQKTIATQRMFPVLATCKAHLDNLRKSLKEVLDQVVREKDLYLTESKLQYAVLFRARHNNSLGKDDVVTTVIDAVRTQGLPWEPEPRTPDCAISVDVLSSVCCISVLPHYAKFKRYNLVELGKARGDEETSSKDEKADEPAAESTKDDDGCKETVRVQGSETRDDAAKDEDKSPTPTSESA